MTRSQKVPWYTRYQAIYDDVGNYEDKTLFPVYLRRSQMAIDTLSGTSLALAPNLMFGLQRIKIRVQSQKLSSAQLASYLFKMLCRYETAVKGNFQPSIEHRNKHPQTHTNNELQSRRLAASTSDQNVPYKYHRVGAPKKEYDASVMEGTGRSIQSKLSCDSISFANAKEIIRGTIRGLRFLHTAVQGRSCR